MPPPDSGQLAAAPLPPAPLPPAPADHECAGGGSGATGDMAARHAMAVGVDAGWARGEMGAEIGAEIGTEMGAGWARGEIRR